jgi:hypothetical protein
LIYSQHKPQGDQSVFLAVSYGSCMDMASVLVYNSTCVLPVKAFVLMAAGEDANRRSGSGLRKSDTCGALHCSSSTSRSGQSRSPGILRQAAQELRWSKDFHDHTLLPNSYQRRKIICMHLLLYIKDKIETIR